MTHGSADRTDDPVAFLDELQDVGVIVEETDDIVLTEEFRGDWRRRIDLLRDRGPVDFLALLLDVDPDGLSIDDGGAMYTVTESGTPVGEWPSEAAVLADLAAFITLEEWWPE